MKSKIKVLQIANINTDSGVASIVMNLYRNINRDTFQFDFAFWNFEESNYTEEIEKLGGTVYKIPHYRKNFLGFLYHLQQLLRNRYDVIHCHEFLASLPALFIAKCNHIPIRIAHSHNPTIEHPTKRLLTKFFRRFFRNWTTNLLACSFESGVFLFGNHASFTVVKNGIDTRKFHYREEIRLKTRRQFNIDEHFIVGNIGRLVTQKNHIFLFKQFQQIHKKYPNSLLWLIGDGEKMQELKDYALELGIIDAVTFWGVQNDVTSFLCAMDVFVCPSIYEGFGIVVLEAQSMGLPCIVSTAIPKVVAFTDSIVFLDLDAPNEYWTNAILASAKIVRNDQSTAAFNAGYDILKSVHDIEQIYQQY